MFLMPGQMRGHRNMVRSWGWVRHGAHTVDWAQIDLKNIFILKAQNFVPSQTVRKGTATKWEMKSETIFLINQETVKNLIVSTKIFTWQTVFYINVTDGLDRANACLKSVLCLKWIRIRCGLLRSEGWPLPILVFIVSYGICKVHKRNNKWKYYYVILTTN